VKKLFVSQQLFEVESLKEVLEQADIPCTIKNQHTSMLAGEVPFAEVFPELWVLRDADCPRAKELLDHWTDARAAGTSAWTCPGCGNQHAGEFTACWRCGRERRLE